MCTETLQHISTEFSYVSDLEMIIIVTVAFARPPHSLYIVTTIHVWIGGYAGKAYDKEPPYRRSCDSTTLRARPRACNCEGATSNHKSRAGLLYSRIVSPMGMIVFNDNRYLV